MDSPRCILSDPRVHMWHVSSMYIAEDKWINLEGEFMDFVDETGINMAGLI